MAIAIAITITGAGAAVTRVVCGGCRLLERSGSILMAAAWAVVASVFAWLITFIQPDIVRIPSVVASMPQRAAVVVPLPAARTGAVTLTLPTTVAIR